MNKIETIALSTAAILCLTACGSRESERAAPEAASMETDATSTLSPAAPTATTTTVTPNQPAQQVDKGGKPGATTPPPK